MARTEEQAIYAASLGRGSEGVYISSSSGSVPTPRSQDLRRSGEAPPQKDNKKRGPTRLIVNDSHSLQRIPLQWNDAGQVVGGEL